jgi:DNA-directed RNA polymerase subunit beta'
VDIAQDVIINDEDCGTLDGITIRRSDDIAGQSMGNRLYSRLVAERYRSQYWGNLVERDEELNHEQVRRITAAGIDEVKVRSPLTCELIHGICSKCYGMDLGRGKWSKWVLRLASSPLNPSVSPERS